MIWRCQLEVSGWVGGDRVTCGLEEVQEQDTFKGQDFERWSVCLDVRFHLHADVELHHSENTNGQDHVLDDDNPEVRKGRTE